MLSCVVDIESRTWLFSFVYLMACSGHSCVDIGIKVYITNALLELYIHI